MSFHTKNINEGSFQCDNYLKNPYAVVSSLEHSWKTIFISFVFNKRNTVIQVCEWENMNYSFELLLNKHEWSVKMLTSLVFCLKLFGPNWHEELDTNDSTPRRFQQRGSWLLSEILSCFSNLLFDASGRRSIHWHKNLCWVAMKSLSTLWKKHVYLKRHKPFAHAVLLNQSCKIVWVSLPAHDLCSSRWWYSA